MAWECLSTWSKSHPNNPMQRRPISDGIAIISRLAFIIGKYESRISEKLIAKEPESERSYGLWSPSRCDVYVASFGPDQLSLRLEVIGDLWRAGVAADLQYDDDRTMDEIVADCISQNIL